MGADRLLVCSFYFYYTPERPVCQGLLCWKLSFDIFCKVWYTKFRGHTWNGRRLAILGWVCRRHFRWATGWFVRSTPSHLHNPAYGRWLQWIVLLHFVICWKLERFWFLWQHLSLHCIKNMATVITRRKRNNRPWSSPTCDGYSITYSQMGADRLLVCSLYFYYKRFSPVCQVCFCLAANALRLPFLSLS